MHDIENPNDVIPICFNTIEANTAVTVTKTPDDYRGETDVTDYTWNITRSNTNKKNISIENL